MHEMIIHTEEIYEPFEKPIDSIIHLLTHFDGVELRDRGGTLDNSVGQIASSFPFFPLPPSFYIVT